MKKNFIFLLTLTCFLLVSCANNTSKNSKVTSNIAPIQQKTQSNVSYQVFDKPYPDGISLDYVVLSKEEDPLIITLTMVDESDESKGFEYHGYTLYNGSVVKTKI